MTGALEMDLLDPNLPPDDPLTFLDVLHAREGASPCHQEPFPAKYSVPYLVLVQEA